jgi:hypothetical protein
LAFWDDSGNAENPENAARGSKNLIVVLKNQQANQSHPDMKNGSMVQSSLSPKQFQLPENSTGFSVRCLKCPKQLIPCGIVGRKEGSTATTRLPPLEIFPGSLTPSQTPNLSWTYRGFREIKIFE